MSPREKQYVPVTADDTLATAFAKRVAMTPGALAYREYDGASRQWQGSTWAETARMVGRVRAGLAAEPLAPGDRVAIMLRNCREWVWFDQAASAQGLVTVPVYVDDRPDNIAYCLNDAGVKLLFAEGDEHLKRLAQVRGADAGRAAHRHGEGGGGAGRRLRARRSREWLPAEPSGDPPAAVDAGSLATIVYTSGTTGRPKGVMLSHRNMLQNVLSGLGGIDVYTDDVFLSFLPLSHMFERTVGYYLTMVSGSEVAFARSIPQLAEDFRTCGPTAIVSVPRIYERLNAAIQGQLREAPPAKRRLFEFARRTGWALFEWRQGRAAWRPSFLLWPVLRALVASKLLERLGRPAAHRGERRRGAQPADRPDLHRAGPAHRAGLRTHGGLARRLGQPPREERPGLHRRGAAGHRGRVRRERRAARARPQRDVGVLEQSRGDRRGDERGRAGSTPGDQAKLEDGLLYITGRIKEIIVMANGEKVPPVDMELAIQLDPLLEQALVVGEGRPFLGALVALDMDEWSRVAGEAGLDADPHGDGRERAEKLVLRRIAKQVHAFPGYAQVRRVALLTDKWTVDNGLLTPTLKPKRDQILERYRDRVADIYRGHAV